MKKTFYPGWWQVVVALLVQAIGAASIFTAYSIVAAPLKAEFQPSNMVLMFGLTVTSLASGILSPPLGSAFDRFSIRLLMAVGASWIAIGFLMLSLTQSMTQVVIVYAAFMAPALVLLGPIGCATLLSRWFNRRRGLAMGLASSGGAVGGLILPPLMQSLIDHFEWRTALQVYGVIIFAVAVPLVLLLLRDRPAKDVVAIEQLTGKTDTPAVEPPTLVLSTKALLAHPAFWLISMVLGTLFAGPMAVISNMVQFVGTKGISAAQGALLLSVLSGANFGGKLVCASVMDRAPLRLLYALMLCGLAISMLGFLTVQPFSMLMLVAVICGLSSGGASSLWSLTLSRVYGAQQIGRVMGIMTLVIMPFTLFSPPVFGWVYDQFGNYDRGFIGYLLMLGLAMLCLARLRLNPVTR